MTSSNGNIFRVTGPLWGESNNRVIGDLKRHRAHYDVTVMDIHYLSFEYLRKPNHKGNDQNLHIVRCHMTFGAILDKTLTKLNSSFRIRIVWPWFILWHEKRMGLYKIFMKISCSSCIFKNNAMKRGGRGFNRCTKEAVETQINRNSAGKLKNTTFVNRRTRLYILL